MSRPLLELLQERIVLFDGGTGTAIYSRGVFLNRCYEELNLSNPSLVEEIHREFLAAGVDSIETNSFSASRPRLEPHGLGDRVREINREAARTARRAAGSRALVAGSVGPLGIRLEPWGPTTFDEAVALYREQIEGLLEGGVDLLVAETIGELTTIQAAVKAARLLAPDLPVIAMMTVDEEGRTPEGVPSDWLAQKLSALEADVIGVNCSVGPAPMLEVIETFSGVTEKPLAAMPNAGAPRQVEGRTLYLSTPSYLASYGRRLADAGARMIGGCCGVTAVHIRAMRAALDQASPHASRVSLARPLPAVTPQPSIPREERTALARQVFGQKHARLVEWGPPPTWNGERIKRAVSEFESKKIDAVLVPDEARGAARMNPMAWATLIQRAAQQHGARTELMLQLACRAKTLQEIQSELLGARALSIGNVMIVTGTTPRPGEGAWAAPDVDVDAIGVSNVVTRLNHGLDIGDNPIGDRAALLAAVQVIPGAQDRAAEIRRYGWKVDAGADLAITTPLFEAETLLSFCRDTEANRLPILASIWPLFWLREAEYMAGEFPGVVVPSTVVERMQQARSAGEERAAGLEIARALIEQLAPHVEGFVLRGPHALDDDAIALLDPAAMPARVHRPFPGKAGMMAS